MSQKQKEKNKQKNLASTLVIDHFKCADLSELVTARRAFPLTTRPDLELALQKLFSETYEVA